MPHRARRPPRTWPRSTSRVKAAAVPWVGKRGYPLGCRRHLPRPGTGFEGGRGDQQAERPQGAPVTAAGDGPPSVRCTCRSRPVRHGAGTWVRRYGGLRRPSPRGRARTPWPSSPGSRGPGARPGRRGHAERAGPAWEPGPAAPSARPRRPGPTRRPRGRACATTPRPTGRNLSLGGGAAQGTARGRAATAAARAGVLRVRVHAKSQGTLVALLGTALVHGLEGQQTAGGAAAVVHHVVVEGGVAAGGFEYGSSVKIGPAMSSARNSWPVWLTLPPS